MQDCDVVIVGAELAGLMAARYVSAAGKTMRVVEAQDRVGGRTLNAYLPGGEVLERGGQRLRSRMAVQGVTDRRVGLAAHVVAARVITAHVITAHIIAFSPAAVTRLRYNPPLPHPREQLTEQLTEPSPVGSVIKVTPVCREPLRRDDGLSRRIYRAGAEISSRWNGCREGGVRSGKRAAREVLAADISTVPCAATGFGGYALQQRVPFGGERRA